VRIQVLFSSNVDQLVQFCALLYLMNVIGYYLEDVICAAWNAERFEEGKEQLGESPELLSCLFFFFFLL
jgi:hypothetical protein